MDRKVLIVEDDTDISGLIEIHLRDMGFETTVANRGDTGLELALTEAFDFMILDIMLPGKDGLEVCRELRTNKIKTPILMLTARSEEIDKILGLEMGADDYLTKPFSIRELTARVKAILRRTESSSSGSGDSGEVLRYDNLVIDKNKRKVILDSERIELTPKEFDLLALMAGNPGKSYSRENLLSVVWGYEFAGYEHTVNSHINRLRSKIEGDLTKPKFILTSWGVGYRFNDELNKS